MRGGYRASLLETWLDLRVSGDVSRENVRAAVGDSFAASIEGRVRTHFEQRGHDRRERWMASARRAA